MAEEKHEKDIKRYSYSRLKTFKECPRKHHYIYVEQISVPDNEFTYSGRMFHKCVERVLKGEEYQDVIEEFENACRSGIIKEDPDLLEYVVNEYFRYYGKDYLQEDTLLVEQELKVELLDDDYMVMINDQTYDRDGYVVVRDIKTTLNSLKYTIDEVKLNQQLLLYIPYIEQYIGRNVDAYEIDEVKLAKLKEVPLLKSGKPSTDKKALSLVLYEDYYNKLCEMGLDTYKEYQAALEYLSERGHPLFKRVKVQLLNRTILDTNAVDINETYQAASTDISFKVKGPLCMYCPFKYLCEQDSYGVDQGTRNMMINNIKKTID